MNKKYIAEAVNAHTNLNLFAAVQALLESGLRYGESIKAETQIIAICKKEIGKQLNIYDAAMKKALIQNTQADKKG